MELLKDKNGVALGLIAGSWMVGPERLFKVKSVTRLNGEKVEYEIQELLFPEGTFKSMIENHDFFKRMENTCSYRLMELPASVIKEQFEKGLLIHF